LTITSKDNETIKHVRKLKEKKYRDEYGEYIIEGIRLINEAIEEKAKIKTILVCDNCNKIDKINQNSMYEVAKQNCLYVDEKVFNAITDVQNPQGILAVVEKKSTEKEIDYNEEVIVVLDDIQDPGNIGTILRTLDSIGISQVVISQKSGDVYNAKVVRSTMGAIFRINIIESENLLETLRTIKKHKFKVVSTSLDTDKSMYDIDYKKVAIVVGNEANGVAKEIQEMSDEKIKIPMLGKTESLNVSVATGIVLYEYVRQKMKGS